MKKRSASKGRAADGPATSFIAAAAPADRTDATSTAGSTPTLDAIGNLHFFIEDNWDALFAECRTDDERSRMQELQGWARDAYLQALADGLDLSADVVDQLASNLDAVTEQIDGHLVVLEDISKAFAVLTKAVKFAAKVAGVVTAL